MKLSFLYGINNGVSPSGKALDFDSSIPRFESWYPSHIFMGPQVESERSRL
jgi:hypothetical protein